MLAPVPDMLPQLHIKLDVDTQKFNYNPCIFSHLGKRQMTYRSHDSLLVPSHLYLANLQEAKVLDTKRITVDCVSPEDVRVVVQDGVRYMFYTWNGSMYVFHLDDKDNPSKPIKINIKNPSHREKNWMFFYQDGWKCVYSIRPWTIISFDSQWTETARKTSELPFMWHWGCPRGGSSPIQINRSWLTTFHSRYQHPHGPLIYLNGFISFDDNLQPIGMSTLPILYPNMNEIDENGRCTLFSMSVLPSMKEEYFGPVDSFCGINKIIVGYGNNDATCNVVEYTSDVVSPPWFCDNKTINYF